MSLFDGGLQRCLILYSHVPDFGSPHANEQRIVQRRRVRKLSNFFRRNGVECLLDQYEEASPPRDWYQWLSDKLEWCDKVVLIITPAFYEAFTNNKLPSAVQETGDDGALPTFDNDPDVITNQKLLRAAACMIHEKFLAGDKLSSHCVPPPPVGGGQPGELHASSVYPVFFDRVMSDWLPPLFRCTKQFCVGDDMDLNVSGDVRRLYASVARVALPETCAPTVTGHPYQPLIFFGRAHELQRRGDSIRSMSREDFVSCFQPGGSSPLPVKATQHRDHREPMYIAAQNRTIGMNGVSAKPQQEQDALLMDFADASSCEGSPHGRSDSGAYSSQSSLSSSSRSSLSSTSRSPSPSPCLAHARWPAHSEADALCQDIPLRRIVRTSSEPDKRRRCTGIAFPPSSPPGIATSSSPSPSPSSFSPFTVIRSRSASQDVPKSSQKTNTPLSVSVLRAVPSGRHLMELSKFVGARWQHLAYALDIPQYSVEAIEYDQRGAAACAHEVLMTWRRRRGIHVPNADLFRCMLASDELAPAAEHYAAYLGARHR